MAVLGAASSTPRVNVRVADPMEMQKAMSPRNRPISLHTQSARFRVRGTPRRERYSFLMGQGTRFLSADTLNDIASQGGRVRRSRISRTRAVRRRPTAMRSRSPTRSKALAPPNGRRPRLQQRIRVEEAADKDEGSEQR